MPETPTFAELESRIKAAVAHFGGALPKDDALAWDGYLAALLEWGLISVSDHETLSNMLPNDTPRAVLGIMLGYDKDTHSAP
jgi:hypothetical protein